MATLKSYSYDKMFVHVLHTGGVDRELRVLCAVVSPSEVRATKRTTGKTLAWCSTFKLSCKLSIA